MSASIIPIRSADATLHDVYRGLGFRDDENVAFCTKILPFGRFESVPVSVGHLDGWSPPGDREVWFNSQSLRADLPRGTRGAVADVVRVRTLHADLDIKDNALSNEAECEAIVDALEHRIGIGCTYRIYTGGGLQPLWRIADGEITVDPVTGEPVMAELERWAALFKRWHVLVGQVAYKATGRAVAVDNTADLARILRCPGSLNTKHPDRYTSGRPVRTVRGTGESITYAQLASVLDGAGIDAVPGGARVTRKASKADAAELLSTLPVGPMSTNVRSALGVALDALSPEGSLEGGRHESLTNHQIHLLRLGERGEVGVPSALATYRTEFTAAVGPDRGIDTADTEFQRLLDGAASIVAGDPTPAHVLAAFEVGGFWHPDAPGGVYAQMGWDTPGQATTDKATDNPAPIFKLLGASDWAKPVPPPQFMVRGILVRDTFGVVAGPKKSLKTHENHALALAVATGQPLYNHDQFSVSRSGRVLYIVGEGGQADIQRKLQRMCRTYGVDPNDVARDPQFPLKVAFGAAPMGDARFNGELKGMLDDAQPDLVLIESFYNFHPEGVEAGNLYQRGQAIDGFHKLVRSECEGATSLMTDHYRSTAGKGNDLDMISMAGQAEVADSWITRHPYADADVDAGEFHLRVAYGSRQWGGREYDIDWHLGRFNEDTGSHEGTDGDDRITWTIAPSGEGTATDKKGGGARGLSESALIDTELLRRIANHSGVSKDECCRAVAEIIKTRKAAVSDRFDTLAAVHRIKAELVEYTKSNGRKDKRNGWFVSDEATNLVVNRADLSDV